MAVGISAIALLFYGALQFTLADRDRSLWVMNTAVKLVSNPERITQQRYGDLPWQTLDVYPAASGSSVMIFVHGGGWYHGRKEQYLFVADAFQRLGYTVVVPDYIKYPAREARFPAHLNDVAQAIAWTKKHIARFGGDPTAICLSGHSAGGHTVALVSTDQHYLIDLGLAPTDLQGVVPIAGPYRFTPDRPATMAVFGPEQNYPEMNPLAFIDGDEPPFFIMHGSDDKTVAGYHLDELGAALTGAKQLNERRLYTGYTHEDMVTHLHPWFGGDDNLANDIQRFCEAQN